MTTSRRTLSAVARAIRPHITPFLEAKGFLTDGDIAELARCHGLSRIASERSCRIVDEILTDDCLEYET